MAGLVPAGDESHGVVPEPQQAVSHAARPAPTPGLAGRDWIVVLEIDAYQKAAS